LRLRDHPVQFHGGGVRDEHRFPQRLCGNCAGKGGKCLRINSQTLFPVLFWALLLYDRCVTY
jgi:hypothetical protein